MGQAKAKEKARAEGKLIKLDIACGQNKPEGWVGIDIAPLEGVDLVHDLSTYPWPVKTGTVEEARAIHYIEHVVDLIGFFEEVYRVLVVGGKCLIISPYYTSMRAWQDPTHVREISEASFLYYNKEWRKSQKLDHYPITCDFDFSYGYAFYPEWAARAQEARDFALKHYNNVVSDIQVTLVKR